MADDYGQTVQGLHKDGDTIAADDQHVAVLGDKSGSYEYLHLDANDALIVSDGGNAIEVEATDLDIRDLVHTQDSVSIGDGSSNILSINASGEAEVITNFEYAEDSAHGSGETGAFVLAVRNDTLASLVDTDGDYAPLQVNSDGALYVDVGTISVSLDSEYAEDSGHTTGDTGQFILAVRNDAGTSLVDTDLDYAPLQVDSTGALRVAATVNVSRDDSTHNYGSANCVKDTITTIVTVSPGSDTDFVGFMVAAPGRCEWDVEFGTTGSEAVIFKVWTTPASTTLWVPFPEMVQVSSGETIRIRATNRERRASPGSDFTGAATLINT